MFHEHAALEHLYLRLLQQAKHDPQLLPLAYTLELERIPFDKRQKVPELEE